MTVPVYTYTVFTIIMKIVDMQDEIAVTVQDLFNAFGTIIITTITIIFLYIIKIYDVFIKSSMTPINTITAKSTELFKAKQSQNDNKTYVTSKNDSKSQLNINKIYKTALTSVNSNPTNMSARTIPQINNSFNQVNKSNNSLNQVNKSNYSLNQVNKSNNSLNYLKI